jgi:glycosyltransferase involved in cell wall biosynthesis
VVLAPRGELFPNALAIKHRRKRLFLRIARRLRLYDGVIFQASSDLERKAIENWFGEARISVAQILVAPDIGVVGESQPRRERVGGNLHVVFLSRICRVKNLHTALTAMRRVESPLTFDVYGPIDDAAYWRECEAIARELPAHVQFAYKGPVQPGDVAGILRGYDLLFLPSLSENFGHVILESLMNGCGVLISDRTPWQDVEEHQVGFITDPMDTKRQSHLLDHYGAMSGEELLGLRSAALGYAERVIEKRQEVIQQNRTMFELAVKATADDSDGELLTI